MSVLTLESLAEAFAKKDAEIARLTADVEYWHHIATVEKNGLITELCDALEIHSSTYPGAPIEKLIQSARDATRCHL